MHTNNLNTLENPSYYIKLIQIYSEKIYTLQKELTNLKDQCREKDSLLEIFNNFSQDTKYYLVDYYKRKRN